MKSPQSRKEFQAKIELIRSPEIHPEDAENAIRALLRRTSKDRRKPPHVILEKLLIASALNDKKDEHQVLPPVWRDGQGREIKRGGDGFETRWKRAQKDGRAPIWDKIDVFMLKNWRVMRLAGFGQVGCPGLTEWNPRAACALIRALSIGEKSGDEGWYIKKRTRLGLKGKPHYRVHDFAIFKDGFPQIDLD